MKVELQRKPWRGHQSLTQSLPFYRGFLGRYIHRVRYGHYLYEPPDFPYLVSRFCFTMWCGTAGTVRLEDANKKRLLAGVRPTRQDKGGELFAVPPDNALCCATCEGRAIGAGLTESRMIAGRMLVFSPRW